MSSQKYSDSDLPKGRNQSRKRFTSSRQDSPKSPNGEQGFNRSFENSKLDQG